MRLLPAIRFATPLLALVLLTGQERAYAQTPVNNPVPAPAQTRPVLLLGTVHTGDGQTVIANGAVAFSGGKITYVGPASGFTANRAEYDVREQASGQEIYPGLILANSTLGLGEIDAVRATIDEAEVGSYNPHVRALIAYNTDNDILPTVRTNGVLLVQVCPRGGVISGQSSVVQLDAWNWEDAQVREGDGLHLNWPRALTRTGIIPDSIVTKRLKVRAERLRELNQLFADGKAYQQQPEGQRPQNLRLAALGRVLKGEQTLYLHADGAKEIAEAVRFARRQGVPKIALVGAEDAARVLDLLRDEKVPVVLTRLHSLPRRLDDDVDAPFRLPAQLQAAGIPFCFSYEGDMENPGARNLQFTAGTAAAYGLTKEQALAAMTSQTAAILGIQERVGTLAVGKDATVIVSRGDLLDMRTNQVTQAYIQGRSLNLTNRQQALAEKYRVKYGQK